jgi:hypothetical protein
VWCMPVVVMILSYVLPSQIGAPIWLKLSAQITLLFFFSSALTLRCLDRDSGRSVLLITGHILRKDGTV